VRYGILFWWVEGCSHHLQMLLMCFRVSEGPECEPLPCNLTGLQLFDHHNSDGFWGNLLYRVPLLLDGIISGHFNGKTTVPIKRESARPCSPSAAWPAFRTDGFCISASPKYSCLTDCTALLKHSPDWRMASAGSTRDQALYSARLALISAILYCIAAIAM
jgi:hypothetical protein